MNKKNSFKCIGLMSGTSLDGLDIAYCHFYRENDSWSFNLLETKSVDYDLNFQKKLKNAIHLDPVSLLAFNNEYGTWLGKTTKKFMSNHNIEVDFIASHGHTIFHQPGIGLTYQIGSGQHLANTTGYKVICDFRTNDVALGGQGAPLVPIGDQLLFSEYDFCLNLGGISNFSYESKEKRIAYDISPANMLLNHICKKIDKIYDHGGKLAQSGKLNQILLQKLNALEYYNAPFPKSLGFEWFTEQVVPIIENTSDTVENLLHTSVYHICQQIKKAISLTQKQHSTLLVTGGGAKNDFLIEVLQQELQSNCKVIVPDEKIIDFKEALIFAFMGVLRSCNEHNSLKSVTGARANSSSGVIYNPS